MAKKIGGLGKGLSAIFVENENEDRNEVVSLKISQIEPNRSQPRKEFDDEALRELSLSIAEHGVLQPILVRPLIAGSYQIVAGERRYRASRLAGLEEVPVIIRELSDLETVELALIENLQREDLSPLEEAKGYQTLQEEYGMSHQKIADTVGKSRSAITNSLRLLSLSLDAYDALDAGKISAGHARALLGIEDKNLMDLTAEEVVKKGLSVRETEKLVKKLTDTKRKNTPLVPKKSNFFKEVELSLSEEFGAKVEIIPGKKKGSGRLCIDFYDEEELVELTGALERYFGRREG